MIINHNMPAINGHRNLGINNALSARTQEKLSSGLRINRAADDAAGLAISENMRSQIRGLTQASRNSQDAISLIQTAEGALGETQSILSRMRELAVQASNDTYTANDRLEIQKEVDQLKSEIDRIGNTTSFNNKMLLDGSASALATTDNTTTSVFLRGTLGTANTGTYKVNIVAQQAGRAQVQVSNIMLDKNTGLAATANQALTAVAQFYDVNGKFLLDNDQQLTLVQGDGDSVTFTISGQDTLLQVAAKFKDAIAGPNGFNQSVLAGVSVATANLANYVTAGLASQGALAVAGAFVLASGKSSEMGNINVLAEQSLLNAFGFSEFRSAADTSYSVTITNAATGVTVANSVAVKGNNILGMLHKNVDIAFDSNTGVSGAGFNGSQGFMSIATGGVNSANTYIHLVDNSQTFQIGANELQNMASAIGDMKTKALGVDRILVTDVRNAGKAITKLDMALSRVSSQRANLGAVQSRLEHTINNLNVAAENVTAAESRIRDADMAAQMMEFTRLNILTQASTAMLAQANQAPQQVLQLLGR